MGGQVLDGFQLQVGIRTAFGVLRESLFRLRVLALGEHEQGAFLELW